MKQTVSFVKSDAGRFPYEKLDCCVRTLSIACEIPYETAHRIYKKCGRMDKHRTYPNTFKGVLQEIANTHTIETVMERGTVGNLLPTLPKGRYIIQVKGHQFAFCDGVIYDLDNTLSRGKKIVKWYRKITKKET